MTLTKTDQADLLVHDPERIPAGRYYDDAFFELEREHLWPHVWQMACRLEQIQNVGDWVEYSNLGKSVIVVHTRNGVKAYQNHCRHRGVPIAGGKGNEHGNCAKSGFICPFHGWRWNMDGANTFVYGRHMFSKDVLDQAELALRSVRVETAIGCAFINFDDDAPGLRETMGPVFDYFDARNVSQLRAEWWLATELPSNWKTAMEAFMEGFHVMRTHPQLQHALPSLYNTLYSMDTGGIGAPINPHLTLRQNLEAQVAHMEQVSLGMSGQCHAKEVAIARTLLDVDLPEDPNEAIPKWYEILRGEITRQLREHGEPVPDINEVVVSAPLSGVEFMFPHYFLLPYFSSMASYRIRPLGPERCLFELWSLTFFPEGEEPAPPLEATVLSYDSEQFPPIPRQDYSNIPIQQIGLRSDDFEVMRLAREEEGLISNYQRLIDGYIRKVAPEKLAAATSRLVGNFDGEIMDLGF
ncbi:MAG: aromatic ring-hydroxylating dioxygenase subunit alpha [Novosphingobium sp.]